MNSVIKLAIDRPVAVIALILLSIVFGFVALQTIPIQMSQKAMNSDLKKMSRDYN